MKIVHVKYPIPDGYYDDCELPDDEIKRSVDPGTELFIYTYATGSYEGTGEALIRYTDGHWCYFDLGHCSCYGPLDAVKRGKRTWPSLEVLEKETSEEAMRVRGVLFKRARRFRSKP